MIEIKHLTKRYGNRLALDDLNIDIEPGRIYGFLGSNGAGKSTTMNIVTGYLAPTQGTVVVNGHDIYKEPEKAKACIGYLPEIPPLYPDMTVLEYLDFVAELKKIPRAQRADAVEEAIVTTAISDVAGRLIRNLSKGYKQRVGLAQAILGKPEIIILDEPTVGLDPAQIIEIRELIAELGKEHTIILSSHILTEISAVCNYIFIISKGKLIAADTTENLMTQMAGSQEVEITVQNSDASGVNNEEAVKALFENVEEVESVSILPETEPDTIHLRINSKAGADIRADVFGTAVKNKLTLLDMKAVKRSLEEVFLELTKDSDDVEGGSEE